MGMKDDNDEEMEVGQKEVKWTSCTRCSSSLALLPTLTLLPLEQRSCTPLVSLLPLLSPVLRWSVHASSLRVAPPHQLMDQRGLVGGWRTGRVVECVELRSEKWS